MKSKLIQVQEIKIINSGLLYYLDIQVDHKNKIEIPQRRKDLENLQEQINSMLNDKRLLYFHAVCDQLKANHYEEVLKNDGYPFSDIQKCYNKGLTVEQAYENSLKNIKN